MSTTFFVPGEPVAQGRPRFSRINGGGVRARDPEKSRDYKAWVKMCAVAAGVEMIGRETAIAVRIVATFSRPKSAPRRRVFPTVKPDIDNVVKGIKDALTGIAWADDAQVINLIAEKVYGDRQGVNINISVAG